MNPLVVDASVVAKWFFLEEGSPACRRLVSPKRELLAPDIVWSEVGNVIWKRSMRGEISPDDAAYLGGVLLRSPIRVIASQALLPAALDLAVATGAAIYDCLYFALAVQSDCSLITADARFARRLGGHAFEKRIRLIATGR